MEKRRIFDAELSHNVRIIHQRELFGSKAEALTGVCLELDSY
jgi:hypothetical protein